MKVSLKKILKIVLPIGIGLFFIWYSLHGATEKEKEELWNSIINANPLWVIISALLGVLAHLSRAYRWRFLVESLGYQPRLSISYMALMIGYLANLGIPRSGEILRAATLSNYEGIPFQKSIGTIISERIIDLVMLLVVVALGFLANTSLFLTYLESKNINLLQILSSAILLSVFLAIGYYVVKKTKIKALEKIKKIILEVYEGILSLFRMKKRIPFVLHTLIIWGGYILMFYVMKFAIPEIQDMEFSATLMAFIVGSFAMTTTNGGIGVFPYSIGLVLLLFNIDESVGTAYGWILWGAQTIANIIVGGFSFISLPFFAKKK